MLRQLEDEHVVCWDESKQKQLADRIVKLSLQTRVLSRFTAYVVVDRSRKVRTEEKIISVVQPVELPEGWTFSAPVATSPLADGLSAPLHLLPAQGEHFFLAREKNFFESRSTLASVLGRFLHGSEEDEEPRDFQLRQDALEEVALRIRETQDPQQRLTLWQQLAQELERLLECPELPVETRERLSEFAQKLEIYLRNWNAQEPPAQECHKLAQELLEILEHSQKD